MRIALFSIFLATFMMACGTHRAYRYSSAPRFPGADSRYDELDQAFTADNFNTETQELAEFKELSGATITSEFGQILPGHPKGPEDKKPDDFQKKIIYNANLSLNVKIPDSTNKELVNIADRYEGYAQSIATDYTVIRVRADKLEMALKDIEELGKIDYRNVKADDVTDAYYDFKIRLDNAERARSRYLELLAKAANVDETLKVEKELERLNGEIDLLKGKLTRIGHLTEYATVSIRLHEKVKPGVLGYVFVGLWEGVKWLFVRG